MLSAKLKEAAGNSADATLYVDDVFSTWLYTGTGATQTITNGIDLAGKGGMTWIKSRSAATDHKLTDTVRGATKALISNTTGAETTDTTGLTAFSSTGFSLGASSVYNTNAATYVSCTFRKAPKFFDVVTYTGNGTLLTVNHNLGVAPGMIIVKRLNGVGDWNVYHRSLTASNYYLLLNSTGAQQNGSNTWGAAPTSTTFTVGNASGGDNGVNGSGNTYVAYLFAHDTSSTGIIQCGSYTGNGSATGPVVTLGWEPQYLMVKNASGTGNWQLLDSMRGMPVGSADATLQANLANAESSVNYVSPTATGFQITSTSTEVNTSGSTYIYMAIRRPNKPPTTGTQVFSPASGVSAYGFGRSNTSPDLFATFVNKTSPTSPAWMWSDRLRGFLSGGSPIIDSTSTAAENTRTTNPYFKVTEDSFGPALTLSNMPTANSIWYGFKRAPGFFDMVCYTGNGVLGQTYNHNLTVSPELIIVKARNSVRNWAVYPNTLSSGLYLNLTGSFSDYGSRFTSISSTTFGVQNDETTNFSGYTYVAYLFATLAGISKVGSYTGNGTGQAIACGFGSGGARFVLIKRTDSTGGWYTFDSARGLTSGSSPYLLLNSTAAEVTGNNGVYASSGGFTLGATASTTTNISGASYIFLAVA
jgi:hypothetical protein